MSKKTWMVVLLVVALALVFPMATLAAGGPPNRRGGAAAGALDAATTAALSEALNEEYHALAVYEAVMQQFGAVQPFVSIAKSEKNHIAALLNLYTRYGLTAPAAPVFTNLPTFDTLEAACAAGAAAEIADAALYDRLFETVAAANVVRVFTNLQSASLNQHLPAFEVCSAGAVSTTAGPQNAPRYNQPYNPADRSIYLQGALRGR